jgi:hypothetical protein
MVIANKWMLEVNKQIIFLSGAYKFCEERFVGEGSDFQV